MISKTIEDARAASLRCIFSEAQNTNVDAIEFYKRQSFVIEGIDLAFYKSESDQKKEVAVFLRKKIDQNQAKIPRLTEINNHYILHTNSTFDVEPQTLEQRKEWFSKFKPQSPYQLLVAEDESGVIGSTGSSRYRDHFSFDQTVEVSIYLAPDQKAKGVSSLLYTALWCIQRVRR